MPAIKLTGFKGIAPKVAPALLSELNAQVAANCRLSSGELQPMREPLAVYAPPVTETIRTIYKADDLWFVWGKDVDVTRSPLPGAAKFIYTGDGEPRITNYALAFGAGNGVYPEGARSLGVPKPATAPTVTPSGGAATDVTRFYIYTFYDDWNQESAISPLSASTTGKPDGTWAIGAMDAAPPNSGDITAITYVDKAVTITTTAAHFNRAGETITLAGVTTVANVNGTWTLDSVNFAAKTMTFTVTTTPTGTYSNVTDTTDTWTRVASWGTCTKRLYRTSGSTSQFQLVAEGITATTYNDTLSDGAIPGDELISASWELPPVDLKGVITLPSGAQCGFSGNEVCFSEPLQPHAWPPEYRMSTKGYPVVGVQQYSSGVVAGTTGAPVMILGHEPGQMMAQPAEGAYPCLSKRSMVSLGNSVVYATAHGMVTVGDTGIDISTKELFTRDEWVAFNPATMIATAVRGRLYLMTARDIEELLIFDYLDGTGLTSAYITASAMFADTLTGKLYIACSCNDDIREFDPVTGAYMSQDWHSKKLVFGEPLNLGAAKVRFTGRYSAVEIAALQDNYDAALVTNAAIIATGDTGGDLGSGVLGDLYLGGSDITPMVEPTLEVPAVTFTLVRDDEPVFSYTTYSNRAFSLPSGYKADNVSVRVQGRVAIHDVEIADTKMGLKNA